MTHSKQLDDNSRMVDLKKTELWFMPATLTEELRVRHNLPVSVQLVFLIWSYSHISAQMRFQPYESWQTVPIVYKDILNN